VAGVAAAIASALQFAIGAVSVLLPVKNGAIIGAHCAGMHCFLREWVAGSSGLIDFDPEPRRIAGRLKLVARLQGVLDDLPAPGDVGQYVFLDKKIGRVEVEVQGGRIHRQAGHRSGRCRPRTGQAASPALQGRSQLQDKEFRRCNKFGRKLARVYWLLGVPSENSTSELIVGA
jgi:hypothetical protein